MPKLLLEAPPTLSSSDAVFTGRESAAKLVALLCVGSIPILSKHTRTDFMIPVSLEQERSGLKTHLLCLIARGDDDDEKIEEATVTKIETRSCEYDANLEKKGGRMVFGLRIIE